MTSERSRTDDGSKCAVQNCSGAEAKKNGLVDKRTFRCTGNQPLTDCVGCALNTGMMKVQYLVSPRNNLEPDYNVPNNTGAVSDQDCGKM